MGHRPVVGSQLLPRPSNRGERPTRQGSSRGGRAHNQHRLVNETPPHQGGSAMRKEEMRVRIAEALGWRWVRDGFGAWWFHPPDTVAKFKPEWVAENSSPTEAEKESGRIAGSGARPPLMPDYPSDLNA